MQFHAFAVNYLHIVDTMCFIFCSKMGKLFFNCFMASCFCSLCIIKCYFIKTMLHTFVFNYYLVYWCPNPDQLQCESIYQVWNTVAAKMLRFYCFLQEDKVTQNIISIKKDSNHQLKQIISWQTFVDTLLFEKGLIFCECVF